MRVPLVAANWKMNMTVGEALSFVTQFVPEVSSLLAGQAPEDQWPEIAFLPPFTAIAALSAAFVPFPISVGAQDLFYEERGAFTGEISASMLRDLGCRYVTVGHSERRHVLGEDGQTVAKKLRAALSGGLWPILCVGETASERERGDALGVNRAMLGEALQGVSSEEVLRIVVAYEPVWAIGTGKDARPTDAAEVIGALREVVRENYGRDVSEDMRFLYGGSVKASNIRGFLLREEVDGALVGGASLHPTGFAELLHEVRRTRPKPKIV